VHFSLEGRDVAGWTLNQSAGGIRAVVEEPLELGAEFEVTVGVAGGRPGRIVWIQEEQDGSIVGVSFLDAEGAGPLSEPGSGPHSDSGPVSMPVPVPRSGPVSMPVPVPQGLAGGEPRSGLTRGAGVAERRPSSPGLREREVVEPRRR
jgi:hypothetical protein